MNHSVNTENPKDIVRRAANASLVKDFMYTPLTYWTIVGVCLSFGIVDCVKYTLFQHFIIFTQMYFLSQMYFILGHMIVHLQNVVGYNPRDFVGPYVAWHHHYEKITGLSDLWVYHRLSTLITPSIILGNLFIWGIPFYLGQVPHYKIMWAYWVPLYFMQSISHEWYHLSRRERKRYFFKPTYHLLSVLETAGIINTVRHTRHHAHTPKNLDEVYQFNDMIFPIDFIFDHLWKFVLRGIHKFNANAWAVDAFSVFSSLSVLFLNIISANIIGYVCK